jgi:prevent-host-death family protein
LANDPFRDKSDQQSGQEQRMDAVSLAEAKARLSKLVARAQAGESVSITRRGKPVARLVAVERPRKRIDAKALRDLTDHMRRQDEAAGEFVRRVRDESRY